MDLGSLHLHMDYTLSCAARGTVEPSVCLIAQNMLFSVAFERTLTVNVNVNVSVQLQAFLSERILSRNLKSTHYKVFSAGKGSHDCI